MSNISIYQYWPNRIDYLRLILVIIGTCLSMHYMYATISLFIVAQLLDSLDGFIARRFNQNSKLGCALDFSIDRITTCAMIILLIMLYPSYWLIFCFILMLDIGSHFLHLYASVYTKSETHKSVEVTYGTLLKLYYQSKTVLFLSCLLYDLSFLMLYLYHFKPFPLFLGLLVAFGFGFIFKCIIHIEQILAACKTLTA